MRFDRLTIKAQEALETAQNLAADAQILNSTLIT